MTEQERWVNGIFGHLKGEFGELVAVRLFQELGYQAVRVGVEHQLGGALTTKGGVSAIGLKQLRWLPDLAIRCDGALGHTPYTYVEVKFRTRPETLLSELRLNVYPAETSFLLLTVIDGALRVLFAENDVALSMAEEKRTVGDVPPLAEAARYSFSDAEKETIRACSCLAGYFFSLPDWSNVREDLFSS